ncbi:MAG: nucleoside triphosphate pyrophosphohydrolase [Clostridia bacterium]|nr:nucleoside triphosphate pyrophosphohydrolase [Clostridia bacterium]
MITVVGLGVEKGDLSLRGKEAILEAADAGLPVFVRTALTRSYESLLGLGVQPIALDDIYEKSRSFATLNKNLAARVATEKDGCVYCVDGAASEDNSVKILLKKRRRVRMIDGPSKSGYFALRAGFAQCSYLAVSAYEAVERAGAGTLSLPLVVYDLDGRGLASDVKLALGERFGDETTVRFVQGERVKKIPLFELDRQKSYDYLTAVTIEATDVVQKTRFTMEDLKEIVVRLRAPGGCPWDRAQTPESIKMNVIEEAYELVDAVDSGDDSKVLEETGDILLQAAFYAVMKEEVGAFTLTDAISGICEKLISRHTHIFGADKAEGAEGALSVWEKNKRKEKHQETFGDSVSDVPKCFPAAMRAQKVGKRAAKSGMDFVSADEAMVRLKEEIAEFENAYSSGCAEETEKELGDVLFSAVNVGRKAGVDCEKALKESTERFAARFVLAEKLALKSTGDVCALSAEEWEEYYQAAKKALKEGKNVE